jgi:hypothetical protein
MRHFWHRWILFWETDKILTVLLILLVTVSFVVTPVSPAGNIRSLFGDVVFSLLLLSGIATVRREKPWIFRLVATVAIGALGVHWFARVSPAGKYEIGNAIADLVVQATFAMVVLAKVLRAGTVSLHRIQGAVAVYLLLGLAWASAYEWVALTDPGAFTGTGVSDTPVFSWNYYSFVTLTTMGYGDITPVNPVARSLATAEALCGQLYLAILIARLVALEISSHSLANNPQQSSPCQQSSIKKRTASMS